MAKKEVQKSSPQADSEASMMWGHFLKASTVVGIVTAIILILMAIFLV